MKIDRLCKSNQDSKNIVQTNIDNIYVSGNLGRVHLCFDTLTGNQATEHLYRISLSKEEAIELVKELYIHLENDL